MNIAIEIAAGAMRGLLEVQQAVANNLANADTAGFRGTQTTFHSAVQQARVVRAVDSRPGELRETDNSMDVALEGEGGLLARTPHGDQLTRGGTLRTDAQGQLCTAEGWPLLSTDGNAIVVGSDTPLIAKDGTVTVDGRVAGRLSCTAPIRQGFIETSNVSPIPEMVRMIETLRSFEYLQHVVRSANEMQRQANTEVGRLR